MADILYNPGNIDQLGLVAKNVGDIDTAKDELKKIVAILRDAYDSEAYMALNLQSNELYKELTLVTEEFTRLQLAAKEQHERMFEEDRRHAGAFGGGAFA